jgi:hypothetical protein
LVGADENADVWRLRDSTGNITANEKEQIFTKRNEIADEKKLAVSLYVKTWKCEMDHTQNIHRSASFFSGL